MTFYSNDELGVVENVSQLFEEQSRLRLESGLGRFEENSVGGEGDRKSCGSPLDVIAFQTLFQMGESFHGFVQRLLGGR